MWPGVWSALEREAGAGDHVAIRRHHVGARSHGRPDPSPSSDSGSSPASMARRTRSSCARMASAGCGPNPWVTAPVAAFTAAAAGEWSGWVWVISRWVTRWPSTARQQGGHVVVVGRARVDDGDVAAGGRADDERARAVVGEPGRVVGHHPANEGRHLFHLAVGGRLLGAELRGHGGILPHGRSRRRYGRRRWLRIRWRTPTRRSRPRMGRSRRSPRRTRVPRPASGTRRGPSGRRPPRWHRRSAPASR